ncbi:unnamed protein product, partial [Choristocarpus tenellus]
MKPLAETILRTAKEVLHDGEVLYIATDEKSYGFFKPFEDTGFRQRLIKDVDKTFYLILDTIVASQGRAFVGTWRSTFTGYITRLRGYYGFPDSASW